MGLFNKLFGRKKPVAPSTSEVARERLTLMLVHDRLKLTPDLLERIKEELLAVISKYVEIEETGVDVELTHTEHSDKLIARMPVRRQRLPFQRDVLEPGMGNPVAAAAALAKIHQPASEAALAAETPTGGTAAPMGVPPPNLPAQVPPAPDGQPSGPVSETEASGAAPAAPAQEAAAPSALTGEASPQAVAGPIAPAASEPAAGSDAQPPVTSQEAPASSAGASDAPGTTAEPVNPAAPAGGVAPTEAPAPAATPTKG